LCLIGLTAESVDPGISINFFTVLLLVRSLKMTDVLIKFRLSDINVASTVVCFLMISGHID